MPDTETVGAMTAERPSWAPSALARRALIVFTTLGLTAATFWYLGYHVVIGLDADDTNHLETPLALTIARQLTEGPGVLYGPFTAARPLVLIHAPLYYRIAALVAWPFYLAGADPIRSPLPFYAGRFLSFLGLIGTCAAAFGLARAAGGSRLAGAWAALLVAGSPVFGSFPMTVRPDTLGTALQTFGALMTLRALTGSKSPGRTLALGYAAFGLAFCVKQHDVMAAAVSTALLAIAWRRGQLPFKPIERAHLLALAVVVAYYGAEEFVTGGMMARSVFLIPSKLREIQPGGWGYAGLVFQKTYNLAIGLLAVEVGCLMGWAIAWAFDAPRKALGGLVDACLLVYVLAELGFMAVLCRNSAGAWTNYAMQAAVFGSVLVARQMARRFDPDVHWLAGVPIAVAVAGFFLVDARLVAISARGRAANRVALQRMFTSPEFRGISPAEVYFVGKPQNNRMFGRLDLAHDEWLYTSYEMLREAEPRSAWLLETITKGPVRRLVIDRKSESPIPLDPPVMRGIPWTVPSLGYKKVAQFGPYEIWDRPPAGPADSSRGGGLIPRGPAAR